MSAPLISRQHRDAIMELTRRPVWHRVVVGTLAKADVTSVKVRQEIYLYIYVCVCCCDKNQTWLGNVKISCFDLYPCRTSDFFLCNSTFCMHCSCEMNQWSPWITSTQNVVFMLIHAVISDFSCYSLFSNVLVLANVPTVDHGMYYTSVIVHVSRIHFCGICQCYMYSFSF